MKRNSNAKRAGDEKGWYAGAGTDQGAWDTNAASNEQAYPMGAPRRPVSTTGESINTIATHDLQTTPRAGASALHPDTGYNLGDYTNGGRNSPYQDYPEPAYGTSARR
jgi:hypothetical protein